MAGAKLDAARLLASGDLRQARRIHRLIVAREDFQSQNGSAIANSLVRMFVKCGSAVEALQIFEAIAPGQREIATWNAMIGTSAAPAAMDLYFRLRGDSQEPPPNRVTFISLLGSVDSDSLQIGRMIHAEIAAMRIQIDAILGTSLVAMYGRCGSIRQAESVFGAISRKDVVAWNAMLSAYATAEAAAAAAEVFDRMIAAGVRPNQITFVSLLRCCSCLDEAKFLHRAATDACTPREAMVVANSAITMYARFSAIDEARRVFDAMPVKNSVSWNCMVAANAQCGYHVEAFRCFQLMQLEGIEVNRVTLVTLLGICNASLWLPEGRDLHQRVVAAGMFQVDVLVATAVLTMYANCGWNEDARELFDAMPRRNVVTWNAMIAAFAARGQCREAVELFREMLSPSSSVVPNKATFLTVLNSCLSPAALNFGSEIHERARELGIDRAHVSIANAILNMYARCGSLAEAVAIFEAMPRRNTVSWNVMVSRERPRSALLLFYRMQLEGARPNEITAAALLTACAELKLLATALALYQVLVDGGVKVDMVLENSLMNLYLKCGEVSQCEACFRNMLIKDKVSWNTMLWAYAENGLSRAALTCFGRMQHEAFKPDSTTFSRVLCACRNLGLVEEGCYIFNSMQEHGVKPDEQHYGCIVDLLSYQGWLSEAEAFLKGMPLPPDEA